MDIFAVFSFVGGLAFFLYGMTTMGSALERASGGRLERILEKMSSTLFRGVLLGAFVTAVIQSSSATTVMVVGFVNSGIMTLGRTVGVIMGANIGTTVTSWLLSLTGISGESPWLNLLKPSSFAPLLALVGIIPVIFVKKNERLRNSGSILIGFSILMFGMQAMSDAVAPLADAEWFASLMTYFENPLLGVAVGALLTAVIQSSSASVGILQALSVTGVLSYGKVFPIIMGQNIGTCATTLISSIGAGKNAKRAALIHFYFNVIGSLIFFIVYFTADIFFNIPSRDKSADAAGIALVHTLFNIASTILLLPFSKQLERLAYISVPDSRAKSKRRLELDVDSEYKLLDERFLNQPAFALNISSAVMTRMSDIAKQNLSVALSVASGKGISREQMSECNRHEELIDSYEDALRSYLLQIDTSRLPHIHSVELTKLLHSIGDIERIGDLSGEILLSAYTLQEKKGISKAAEKELSVLAEAVEDIVSVSLRALNTSDGKLAHAVEPLEELIDLLADELKTRHIERLKSGECSVEFSLPYTDIITACTRIADHCSNLAVAVIRIKNGSFDAHEYLRKYSLDRSFREKYEIYREKYVLPSK